MALKGEGWQLGARTRCARSGHKRYVCIVVHTGLIILKFDMLDLRRRTPRIASDGTENAYYAVVNYLSDTLDVSHRRPIAVIVAELGCEQAGRNSCACGWLIVLKRGLNIPVLQRLYQLTTANLEYDLATYMLSFHVIRSKERVMCRCHVRPWTDIL